MNIIIAGDGEVGLYLAQELANENHDITIIDQHEDMLRMVESHTDLMTIMGNPTCISVLENANVKKADRIDAADSKIAVLVLDTNEEIIVARETVRVVNG